MAVAPRRRRPVAVNNHWTAKMKYFLLVLFVSGPVASTIADESPGLVEAAKPFVHPGLLHSRTELNFIQQKISTGQQPWKSAWEQLQSADGASLDYAPKPCAKVVRGVRNNPNIGSSDMSSDAAAAYAHALQWSLTQKKAHATKAIEVLNAWATTLESVTGHDAKLLVGMDGVAFCNAAELIRHTSTQWQSEDQKQFERMLRRVFYPVIEDFYPTANGNWDASMIQTMIAMGVFLDDQAMFDRAVNYYLDGKGNGAIRRYFNDFGECQESGRDQSHVQMGIGFLACACEMAWKQGVDLYGAADNRLALGFEYTAKYNLGDDVPYERFRSVEGRYDYPTISRKGRGRFRPIYERIVHHYHDRMGLEMPYSRRVASKKRPEGSHRQHMSWGTLTSYGQRVEAVDDPVIATDGRKPNILFIAVDDLRPSLGCYGDKLAVSPNIDALAARGVTFNRAYCQVAVCNPSRASLMTGLRPDTLGVWTLPIHFREAKPDAVTMPQWLRKSGYTAVSHGKIYHNPTPDPQSWSEPIRDRRALPFPYPQGTRELVSEAMRKLPPDDWRKDNLRRHSTASPDLPDNEVLDGARTDMCIEDLKRLGKSSQPFMLAMGYIRPHLAFVAPKKYWDMHDPETLPIPENQQTPIGAPPYSMHSNSELSHYVDLIEMPKPWDEKTLPREKMRQLIHGYYACVSYVDAQIGRLLKALDEEGLRENTIVVLWSDHGWKLGEYRGWGKMTNYEIDARVPLIISGPGMKIAGQTSDALVELLDLYPTLCEMTGAEVPSFVEGKSLVPVLRDPTARVHQSAVSQYYRKHEEREYMGYSLRTDQYRYIEWRDFGTGEMVEQELYDHNESEMETVNLIQSATPEVVKRLGMLLNSTHPPKQLDMVPAVHTSPSGPGRLAADISFENETDTEITVHPINNRGRRSRGRKIAPGKSYTFNARIGGTYVVESNDGTIHEIHSPSWPSRSVVIRK